MGYYTRYSLEWNIAEESPAIEYYINQHKDDFGVEADGSTIYDEVKWYHHDEDMIALSKAFPRVTFILSGKGEEQPDMWKHRYKNGKMEWARVPEKYSPWRPGPDPGREWEG